MQKIYHSLALLGGLALILMIISCDRPSSQSDQTTAKEEGTTEAVAAVPQEQQVLPDLEPAKLPPPAKPEKPERFVETVQSSNKISLPITLQTPPDAIIEKSAKNPGDILIRAYDDDYSLVSRETDYEWEPLLEELKKDKSYTFRRIVMEYESSAMLEVALGERLEYIVVGLVPGIEDGTFLIRSNPQGTYSKWGADQMFRTLRQAVFDGMKENRGRS